MYRKKKKVVALNLINSIEERIVRKNLTGGPLKGAGDKINTLFCIS